MKPMMLNPSVPAGARPLFGAACLLLGLLPALAQARSQVPALPTPATAPLAVDYGEATPPTNRAPMALYTVGPHANCDFSQLQPAIDAAASGDTIRVARSSAYLGSTYDIWGKSLTIEGGVDTCDLSETPNGHTDLDANGVATSGRLIDIWESLNPPALMQVTLKNLRIRRGGAGGITVEGQLGRLAVSLENVTLQLNNSATRGGGIYVRAVGATISNATTAPLLTVDNTSILIDNSSSSFGGGIACESTLDPTSRTMVRVGSALIFRNSAQDGGGLANLGCHNMFLYTGSPIVLILPSGGFYLNTASGNGGAIYAAGGSTRVRGASFLGMGEVNHAAILSGNTAGNGGAVYATGASTQVELISTVVVGNSADNDGGGVLLLDGAELVMRPLYDDEPACLPAQVGGGVSAQPRCSVFRDNEAGGFGGALRLLNGATANVVRTAFHDNAGNSSWGGAAVAVNTNNTVVQEASTLSIEGALITGNASTAIVYAGNRARVQLRWSTIAGNTADVIGRMWSPSGVTGRFDFLGSIVYDNGGAELIATDGDGSIAYADCVIGPQPVAETGLTSNSYYRFIDPLFVNAADGDYRLAAGSPGIDFCDDVYGPTTTDLDGNERGETWTGPPPGANPDLGPFDLGAWEAKYSDVIFANGFE
ncbi:putative outer membrane repeat protein [Pseudofulvimonas gallinarii]|uniref:Putative outer membrane repeat protein n=2 Tax=Pseudofulvimonas gallinarii TaxID=634155 RepID=A0A4R3LQ87_9GAMM|nr:putative outer membrane repeat protein [Pseudofulvimonas gallinarii]